MAAAVVGNEDTSIFKLDVGGTFFTTTAQTLMAQESMLRALVTNATRRVDGRIFIDRDGTHFRYILNFLRDGFVLLPKSTQTREELRIEASYYALDKLVDLIDFEERDDNALTGKSMRYLGEWMSGSRGSKYALEIVLKQKAATTDLAVALDQAEQPNHLVPIEGHILYTLLATPEDDDWLRDRIGDSGREFVSGTFNPADRTLEVQGTHLDQSAKGLLGEDAYRLTIDATGHRCDGVSRGNEGLWNNRFSALSEHLTQRESTKKSIGKHRAAIGGAEG